MVFNPYQLIFGFSWALILLMVLLCLTYSVHSFILTYWDAGFHAAGTSTQLVDLPNRKHIILNGCGWAPGWFMALPSLYYAYFHSGTVMDSSRGFVDIVKLSLVIILSLITYIGSASQHVLYMKLLISNSICIVFNFSS